MIGQDVIVSLPLLDKDELLRVYVQTQELLNKQLLSDRRLQRFYSILTALLSKDGIKIPPLHAPAARQFIPQLSSAWQQVKLISDGSNNLKVIATSTRLVYVAARARLLYSRVPISFKTIMGQMQNGQTLLESAFPGYSRLVARELSSRAGFGATVDYPSSKTRHF